MMLLIFICPALQNPYSAGRGATKASEPHRIRWRPQLHGELEKKGKGPRRVSLVSTARARGARQPPPHRARVPRYRGLGCDPRHACPQPGLALCRSAGARKSSFPWQRDTRPPRPHRFLNHRRSIYWKQINSPFWKCFNCGFVGGALRPGGRGAPRGRDHPWASRERVVTAMHPHLGGPPTSPRVRDFSSPQFPLVAGHDIWTPRPSTLTSRHVRMPSDASESPEHPKAKSEIRLPDGHPFPASDSRIEPRWSADAAPPGRSLRETTLAPSFPGTGPRTCQLLPYF